MCVCMCEREREREMISGSGHKISPVSHMGEILVESLVQLQANQSADSQEVCNHRRWVENMCLNIQGCSFLLIPICVFE